MICHGSDLDRWIHSVRGVEGGDVEGWVLIIEEGICFMNRKAVWGVEALYQYPRPPASEECYEVI